MEPIIAHAAANEPLATSDPSIPIAAASEDSSSSADVAIKKSYRTYVLWTLSFIGFVCAVDRVVISMFMQPIQAAFHLSDTQLGIMTGVAFALLNGIVAVPLARMADERSRKLIIGASLLVWTVMTAATGVAMSYMQILVARIGVGVGEAGCIPASHSMIGDYYPRELRTRALGAHTAGTFLGLLGGMLGGGILVQTVGWRYGFIWLGIGGLVLSVIFHLTVREPVRVDQLKQPVLSASSVMARLGDRRSFALLVVAFATTALAGSVMTWLPTYLSRAFTLTPIQIGLGLGLSLGVATAIGCIVGGQLGNHYSKRSRSWGARFSGWNSLAVMPMYLGTFFAPSPAVVFILLFATFVVAGMITGPVFAMLQDLVDPSVRATAVAIVSLAGVVVGQGMGPVIVGSISDHWFTHPSSAESLRMAMTIVAMINFLTVWAFWSLARRIDSHVK